jgi:acylphosphatase
VTGEVQGVGYRASAAQEATRLGLVGWVRNETDGAVRAHLEGDAGAVEEMVRWCHDGPPHARVSRVDVDDAEPEGLTSFDVRY